MAVDCNSHLTTDILVDCDNIAIGGLDGEKNLALIPKSSIDRAASTLVDGVVNIKLKPGKQAVFVSAVKQTNSKNYAFAAKDNAPDKVTHGIAFVVHNPSAANKFQISQLLRSEAYVAVVQQNFKGDDNKDAFEVLGFDCGLFISDLQNNSNENDNTIQVSMASRANFEEPNLPYTFLDTDYETSLAAFENRFVNGSPS